MSSLTFSPEDGFRIPRIRSGPRLLRRGLQASCRAGTGRTVTDTTLVLRKLTTLLVHVSRVERRRPDTLEPFQNDTDRQDALALSLVVALQEAVDVSLHMAADEGWGIASSYTESFELLAAHGVLSLELSAKLGSVAALRNRLAHGYGGAWGLRAALARISRRRVGVAKLRRRGRRVHRAAT